MNNEHDAPPVSSAELMLALSDVFPEQSYGSIPTDEHAGAFAAWATIDQRRLSDVPPALAAYLDYQRRAGAI